VRLKDERRECPTKVHAETSYQDIIPVNFGVTVDRKTVITDSLPEEMSHIHD
jgi:hypothetical protein